MRDQRTVDKRKKGAKVQPSHSSADEVFDGESRAPEGRYFANASPTTVECEMPKNAKQKRIESSAHVGKKKKE